MGMTGGFDLHSNSHGGRGVWTDIIKVIKKTEVLDSNFKNSFVRKVTDGATTSFWHDAWCGDGTRLKDKFARLFALDYFNECKVKDIGHMVNGFWVGTWSWRISPWGRALDELNSLTNILNSTILSTNGCDKWCYDVSGTFKVKSLTKVIESSLLSKHNLSSHHKWNS
ncbi:hypothetical protein Tco_0750003 [Tanacetum coccineum]|uniref:Reverse transcriptase zinc-binding domain-containing protein n=1 Tax=Tanacetum coccineum TaxID=301880 RepID=A0ABQ4Z0U7_9ASTR